MTPEQDLLWDIAHALSYGREPDRGRVEEARTVLDRLSSSEALGRLMERRVGAETVDHVRDAFADTADTELPRGVVL